MSDNPNVPEAGQPVVSLQQQFVEREIRMVVGDLAVSLAVARARCNELEALLAARDLQIAALMAGKPKVVAKDPAA